MRKKRSEKISRGLFRLLGVMLGMALLPLWAATMEPDETFADAPEADDAPLTQAVAPVEPPSAAALALEAGAKGIESYPGQTLSKQDPNTAWDRNASAETIQTVTGKLS